MEHDLIINGETKQVKLEKQGDHYRLVLGDNSLEAEVRQITPNILLVLTGNRSLKLHMARGKEGMHIFCRGDAFIVSEPEDDQACFFSGSDREEADMLLVKAPMPGKVIKLHVKEKDVIQKNQTLVIVEAMKMENEIKARVSGRVKKIHVAAGELVDSTRPMLELELEEEPEA